MEKDKRYFIIQTKDSTYLIFDDLLTGMGELDEKGNYQNELFFLARNCESLKNQAEQVSYDEKSILNFMQALNNCLSPSSASKIYYVKPHSTFNIYAYAGGLPLGNEYEYTGRIIAHFGIPSVNKKVFLNIGVNYMYHAGSVTYTSPYVTKEKYIQTTGMFSLPLTVQYNFTNGFIKPYIDAGPSIAYEKISKAPGDDVIDPMSPDKQDFGLAFSIAAGIDASITKQLTIKAEWRYDLLLHFPTIGIAYWLK